MLGNWRSSQWSSGENISAKADDTRIGKIPARFVWDLKGGYKFGNKKLNFGVHNLLNAKYITTYLPLGPRPGAPLHVYFGLSADY